MSDRPPRPARSAASAALALALAAASLAAAAEVAELGRLDFPNSGAPEAHDAFLRGVLLLHSFEFEDAREAFQAARAIDPDFVMAAWGEAMTHNHPLWRQQDRDAALAALARLAPTHEARLTLAGSDRERGYLEAVATLYGEGSKQERDAAYEEAMRRLSASYPDDLEAKAFYALSILGSTEGVRDFQTFMRAGAVAEEVFAANPRHPGAAHYLIHSYDDPVHAPLGLRAARVYADIAPAASHAQHMISHIFVALGRWEESVEANRISFEVSRERAERKGLGVDELNYHALHWLEYSYLQLGRWDEARELLDAMERYAAESGSNRARWYHAAMRGTWTVETAGLEAPGGHGAGADGFSARLLDLFADGYGAFRRGELDRARDARRRLSELVDETIAGGELRTDEAADGRILEQVLRGAVAFAGGDPAAALAVLGEAAAAEGALPLEYGPPEIVKPAHELLGEMLLELGRPAEARVKFEQALARAPRRTRSFAGLAAAARAEGDASAAVRACDELASIWVRAEPAVDRPAACGG